MMRSLVICICLLLLCAPMVPLQQFKVFRGAAVDTLSYKCVEADTTYDEWTGDMIIIETYKLIPKNVKW